MVWAGVLGGITETKFYTLMDSRTGGPSYRYVDLPTSGGTRMACNGDCDDFVPPGINIAPREIEFFGVPYSQWFASTNGIIQPISTTDSTLFSPLLPLPNPFPPNNLIAPLWEDLDLRGTSPGDAGGGSLWYQVRDHVDPARPDDVFLIVQWKDAQLYGNPASTVNFEVFARTGANGEICTVYGSPLTLDLSTPVLSGLENSTGSLGGDYYYNGVPADHAPVPGVTVCGRPVPLPRTQTITYQAIATVTGNLESRVTVNQLLGLDVGTEVSAINPTTNTVGLPIILNGTFP